ncbi:AAA family ATPase [Gemmatimonas sp.]
MTIVFQRATRRRVKIKMLLKGPTGSGKTYGALHVADGLAPGKIVLLDSEHDRSEFYADVVPFDRAPLEEHTPKSYIAHIRAAVDAGYEVIIVDSLSHCWMNVLERKDAYDKANPRSNQWTNWGLFGAEWDELMRTILEVPAHIICTARSKMAHEQVEQGGRKQVVKLGLAPQLRDNTEYEFAICFDVEQTTDRRHPAQVSKDNTNLLSEPGKVWDLADGAVPALIRKWMETAREVERPLPETQQSIDDALLALPEELQAKSRRRVAQYKQQGFPEAKAQEVLAQLQVMIAGKSTKPATPHAAAAPSETAPTPVVDSAPMAPPAMHDAEPEPASSPESSALAEAERYTVMVGQEQKALGSMTTKALEKLRPMAAERERTDLVANIDVVLTARRQAFASNLSVTVDASAAASQSPSAAFENAVAQHVARLGAPSYAAAGRTTLPFPAGQYQLQMLNTACLQRQRRSGRIHVEQAAAIDAVLDYRSANPFDPAVIQVEETLAPDEVPHAGVNSRFD